jgi:acyl-CoA synthetase (AMP-forming)/AMP-acid ligase II
MEILDRLRAAGDEPTVVTPEGTATAREILDRTESWQRWLERHEVPAGAAVGLVGEYGPRSISLLLALIENRNIVVPLTHDSRVQHKRFSEIANVTHLILADDSAPPLRIDGAAATPPLYTELRARDRAGLVLFSSGSTGAPKAAVHDFDRLLKKFAVRRRSYRTLVFLQLDHIGGINTLFYALSNGGSIVTARDRSPAAVCEAIEAHRVTLLPTSPTFLNLLLLCDESRQRDLSSLELITYGTEPMPASTLARVAAAFPDAQLRQTYGLTELGILRSQSRDSNSLWVRVGGEGYETKVVDGRLWVRAESAMLGYLNAPSPFDAEGFFDTGDYVERDGDWLRFLGRKSDLINVGGRKVWPAEVETVLLDLPNVSDVVVRGAAHPLVGQVVAATVALVAPEPLTELKVRLRRFCSDRLESFKVPAIVAIADGPLYSSRFKRDRSREVQPS